MDVEPQAASSEINFIGGNSSPLFRNDPCKKTGCILAARDWTAAKEIDTERFYCHFWNQTATSSAYWYPAKAFEIFWYLHRQSHLRSIRPFSMFYIAGIWYRYQHAQARREQANVKGGTLLSAILQLNVSELGFFSAILTSTLIAEQGKGGRKMREPKTRARNLEFECQQK